MFIGKIVGLRKFSIMSKTSLQPEEDVFRSPPTSVLVETVRVGENGGAYLKILKLF